jgi:hypothetical protein
VGVSTRSRQSISAATPSPLARKLSKNASPVKKNRLIPSCMSVEAKPGEAMQIWAHLALGKKMAGVRVSTAVLVGWCPHVSLDPSWKMRHNAFSSQRAFVSPKPI